MKKKMSEILRHSQNWYPKTNQNIQIYIMYNTRSLTRPHNTILPIDLDLVKGPGLRLNHHHSSYELFFPIRPQTLTRWLDYETFDGQHPVIHHNWHQRVYEPIDIR
jgi:hypothetical protein